MGVCASQIRSSWKDRALESAVVRGSAATAIGDENGAGGFVRTHILGRVAARRSGATARPETRHSVRCAGNLAVPSKTTASRTMQSLGLSLIHISEPTRLGM